MSKTRKRTPIFLAVALIAILLFAGLVLYIHIAFGGKDYQEDIVIPIEEKDGEIVIREYQIFHASLADIYYRKDGKLIELGELQTAKDGWFPFEAGEYEIRATDREVFFRWRFRQNADDWRSERFILPE